jgi:tRNA G18 (ribose-2'-O)-methylase SpoU
MGETRVVLRRELVRELDDHRPEGWIQTDSLLNKEEKKEKRGRRLAVLLDNIRSAWNVGSILRSADGFGFMHAYLCGITPTADNEAVTKTSLGAEDSVPWSYHKDATKLVKGLKAEGWKIYALEDDPRAHDLRRALPLTGPTTQQVLIVGNEITGVDPELLDQCEKIFSIPMQGEKKSFNVAIAFSIAAYALAISNPESKE